MHTGTQRKLFLALIFWLALHVSALKAQIFTAPLQASTTGTDPVDFEFRADGTMIAKGNYGVGSLLSGDQGAGTRLLWFPSLGAFRAGEVDDSEWDSSNIGAYSVAFGLNTTASAIYSAAFGYATSASGGGGIAAGVYSQAVGWCSTASGYSSWAAGSFSLAGGRWSSALNFDAVAWGRNNTASGVYSTATGDNSTASGTFTTAWGLGISSESYSDFAMGAYNVAGGNPYSWVSTDPLFEIGNGTSTAPSDALVVYKNGDAAFQGSVTVAPTGDIPMYTGN